MSLTAMKPQNVGLVSALVIDDNAFDRRRLIRFAEQSGLEFIIQEAADPEEFGRALDQDKYDVIYVDLSLPGISGMDLLPAVRKHSVNHNAAMIMIAGDDQAEVALEAVRTGFADYIEKDRLSATSLERATVNALQKTRLSNVATKAEADTKSLEALLNNFAEACSQEMRPMLSRMVRHVRQLRNDSPKEGATPTHLAQIENTCARMDEFLQDLASLADEGKLSSILNTTQPVQAAPIHPGRPESKTAPTRPDRPQSSPHSRPKATEDKTGWDLIQKAPKSPSLFRRKP